MASIELKNVTKIYEGFKALDALNLTVPSGSVYGLIGPNGAGKTTAIRHMMGVLRQDAGSVLLDGEPVFENPSVKARMLCILEDVCDHVGIMQRGRCLLEKSVSELQETTTKVLLALPDGTALPEEGLDILHRSSTGKLQTLILRGREEDNLAWLEKLHPLFMDSVPLTLEEIFIYELGGVDDAVRKNVL